MLVSSSFSVLSSREQPMAAMFVSVDHEHQEITGILLAGAVLHQGLLLLVTFCLLVTLNWLLLSISYFSIAVGKHDIQGSL